MHLNHRRLIRISIAVLCTVALVGLALAADYPAPVQKAIERCAYTCHIGVDAVTVVSYDPVEWPDTSLGAPRPGRVYAQVITPGFKVVLTAEGRRYEYHTDLKDRVVLAAPGEDTSPATRGPAVGASINVPSAPRCRLDLAQRLKATLDEISVTAAKPATFTDGSLGFPRPGEVYTKAIEHGHMITLSYRNRAYLYAATDRVCRYGGPADARQFSALYIERIENNPNMNGNLVQIALAGDNPVVLLEEVDNFRPQPDGSILVMRRTSRSGSDLLYLAPKSAQAVRLASGLVFSDAAVSPDGKRWAAITRPRLGSGWWLITGAVAQAAEGQGVEITEGIPQRVYMHTDRPLVRTREGKTYELADGAFRPVQFDPPAWEDMLLNRSYTLVVETRQENGQPVTIVGQQHFSGTQETEATIEGFALDEFSLAPGKRFVLLSGKSGEEWRAYTVDRLTGEVLQTVTKAQGPVRLLLAPSASPIVMSDGAD